MDVRRDVTSVVDPAGDPMRVEVEQLNRSGGNFDAQLFRRLARRNYARVGLANFGVPTRLHPKLEVLVEDQRRAPVRAQHHAATRSVPRRVLGAIEGIRPRLLQPVDDRQLVPPLALVDRAVRTSQRQQLRAGIVGAVGPVFHSFHWGESMSEQVTAASGFKKLPIDDMEAIWGGGFKRARAALDVTAFGMSVSDLPPNFEHVPPHVHTFDGQEEVYIALAGGGWMEINGERVPLTTDNAIRVGPTATRRPITGPDGLRLLSVGGTPGKAYEPFPNSMAGAPEASIPDLPGVQAAHGHESSDDYVAKNWDEMEPFIGVVPGVEMYPVRRALGIEAFGISRVVLERDADTEDYTGYPDHEHSADGQEEVYVIARGSGELKMPDVAIEVGVGDMIRVAADVKRKFIPSEDGLEFIAIGAPIGKAYEAPQRG